MVSTLERDDTRAVRGQGRSLQSDLNRLGASRRQRRLRVRPRSQAAQPLQELHLLNRWVHISHAVHETSSLPLDSPDYRRVRMSEQSHTKGACQVEIDTPVRVTDVRPQRLFPEDRPSGVSERDVTRFNCPEAFKQSARNGTRRT